MGTKRRFGETYCRRLYGRKIMQARNKAMWYVLPKRRKTFHRTTRYYIPDYSTLHSYRCGNPKSDLYKSVFMFILVNSKHFNCNYSTHKAFPVFTSRCLVADSNNGRSPSSGFPNCPRPQLPSPHFSQLQLSTVLVLVI
jgi:hypothetical protein